MPSHPHLAGDTHILTSSPAQTQLSPTDVGTCESEIFVWIESRIESAATIQIRIESRIESGV